LSLGVSEQWVVGRHPVYNDYLPQGLENSVFLQTEEEYRTSRAWNEGELKIWEQHKNNGAPWPGQMKRLSTDAVEAVEAQDAQVPTNDVSEETTNAAR
jgi:hypothetical protein